VGVGVILWFFLAASSAHFAFIASLCDDKDGTTEFDVSSTFPDAVYTCLG
jgi:hypothetical protein